MPAMWNNSRMRRGAAAVAWFPIIALLAFCAGAADDAPPGTAPLPGKPPLVRIWSHPGTFEKVKDVTLIDDTLYLSGLPRGLEAINVQDGSSRWKRFGKLPVDQPPTVRDDTVYLVEGGQFVTVNAESGTELSRNRVRLGISTPVFPTSATWIIGANNERLYGLFPGTGLTGWRLTLDSGIADSVWDGGEHLYLLTTRGTLCAVSTVTRSLLWQYKLPKPHCSSLALVQDAIYVGCQNYRLYSIHPVSGRERMELCLSAPVLNKPFAAGGRVYVSTADRVLHAVDPLTQSVVWTIPNADRPITTTDDYLIFLRRKDDGNSVGLADLATGSVLAEAPAANFEHFVAAPEAGVFYAVAANGDVYAIAEREVAEEYHETMRRRRAGAPPAPPSAAAAAAPTAAPVAASPEQAVRELIEKFARASASQNIKDVVQYLTPESAEFMQAFLEAPGGEVEVAEEFSVEIGSVQIAGDEAQAETKVTADGAVTQQTLHLRRVDGIWKIDLLKETPFSGEELEESAPEETTEMMEEMGEQLADEMEKALKEMMENLPAD